MEKIVFPACAGMFLEQRLADYVIRGFPRMRGDVPSAWTGLRIVDKFSPHARGCSGKLCLSVNVLYVFPACAGMFRFCHVPRGGEIGFPRMRGDVPPKLTITTPDEEFSPHARGCSDVTGKAIFPQLVFPACAGMFRCARPL